MKSDKTLKKAFIRLKGGDLFQRTEKGVVVHFVFKLSKSSVTNLRLL